MLHEYDPTAVVLSTRLRTFTEGSLNFKGVLSPEAKKRARMEISIEKTSETLGFLHAALLEISGKYYLLAGPSGIGKTTYSDHLQTKLGASVLAKDWVAVEKEADKFYVSDLNFAENLRHLERCLLSGIIFLTHDDQLKRDAFAPNEKEFRQLLRETFDTASDLELDALSLFWLKNNPELPFLCVVPARRGSENIIVKTLTELIKREDVTRNPIEVGVIGLGSIGTELAFQLGQLSYVGKVHLYNRSQDKTIGIATDMNHSSIGEKRNVFVAHSEPEDLLTYSSAIFLAFRDKSSGQTLGDLPERWQKLPGHLESLNRYAHAINASGFSGTFFMVTNPVDIMTYALYQRTQGKDDALRTYQVYGVGLEVDAARALYYGRQIDPTLSYNSITVYGNHSDGITIKTPLSDLENTKLSEAVNNASREIRRFIPRTIFGPVGAAIRTFRAFQENGQAHVIAIQENAFIGRMVSFRFQLPVHKESSIDKDYQTILKINRDLIDTYLQK